MIQVILLLFMSVNSWSGQECSRASTMEGVSRCVKEFNETMTDTGRSPSPCTAFVGEEKKSAFENLSEEFSEGGAVCTDFITDNGDSSGYGPWGEAVIGYLKEQGPDSIFMSPDLAGMSTGVAACPNWKDMSVDEKEHFWVWVMASISKIESTCNPKAKNGASTNGVAVGLVQLDERPSQRKWRGVNCKVQRVNEPNANLRCGLDIIGELLKGKEGEYKGNGELWGRRSGSYWQHLRQSNGGGISDLIKLNPYCKK